MKINQIKENDKILGYYLVKEKSLAESKNGSKFINMDLCDNTGEINAKVWDKAEPFYELFEKGDIIKLQGRVVRFKGAFQFSVTNIRKSNESDNVDLEDFLPRTKKDIEKLFEELVCVLETVEDKTIKKLIDCFLEDADLITKFKRSIAARSFHHNYIGGLLEHTLSVVKSCEFFSSQYDCLNRDLLILVAFLHDLGKIYELKSNADFNYTVEGNLKGHIVIGVEMLKEKVSLIKDFPLDLLLLIEHAILSHHGQLEWGAPVLPKTPEAIVLHYADNIDAKCMQAITEIDKHKDQEDEFTPYNFTIGKCFFKG